MQLSVIIPARDEAANLAGCLASLTAQQEDFFRLGQEWEIVVVDDNSTDETATIAESFAGVTLLQAPALPEGWTGKANAAWAGAERSQGDWLLFTDADTVHEPGNLRRALHESEHYKASLLSYSPRQIVQGFWLRAVMPLVFAELAASYPPQKVSDPASRIAAANGQFLLVARAPYFKLGGHKAVSDRLLEDVEIARRFKHAGHGLRFRYAPDAVSARMYRSLGAMVEGWTKNLALLFDNTLTLAAWRALDLLLIVGLPIIAWHLPEPLWRAAVGLLWLRVLWRQFRLARRSNFSAADCWLAILGLPIFIWMLWNSWFRRNVVRQVSWKGRSYKFR